MTRKTKYFSHVILILLMFLLVKCNDRIDENEIIASVGSKKLRNSEIDFVYPKLPSQINKKAQKNLMIKQWVDTELLYQAAKENRSTNNENIEQKIKYYKKQLIVQNYLDNFVYNNIQFPESEILERYKNNKESYMVSKPTAVILSYITNDQKESDRIKNILTLGDEERIILLNSKYNTKQQIIKKDNIVPKFEKEVFSQHNKKIVGPFKTKVGFVVIKIIKIFKKGEQIPLVFVKDKIKEKILIEKQNNSYKNLIKKLRKQNKVKIYETNI